MERKTVAKILIVFSLPLSIIFSSFLGRYPTSPIDVLEAILSALAPGLVHSPPETVERIVLLYRLPRVLAAALVGIALATSGASLQAMLRNPLVSTHILGITAGAAFGAALAIALLPWYIPIELVALVFALLAFIIVFAIAWGWGRGSIVSLVLSGVIVNALFSAALSLVKFLTPDPHRLASITFWLMGDIGQAAKWSDVERMAIVIIPCTIVLVLMRWRLNILSLGDEEARALGVNPVLERGFCAVLCALMAATAVSYAGIIGWVGLLVPHIIRLAIGSDNRDVIFYTVFLGGTYMVLADDLARCLTTEVIPIGILTTLMGAPLFIYLLRRAGRVWR
ncbi:iron ABC transporter permease [Desulfurococcaceae archaeon MEX13E-LK6-19]|nr:iron ABC transporter permease [Desulfurococcaceae archaeon MEX13E-LK6-19]